MATTLSEQLTRLYESRWEGLQKQLEAKRLKQRLQAPLLVSLFLSGQEKEYREREQKAIGYSAWYTKKSTARNEEWYTTADIKVMFFGQETNSWERDADVGDLMAAYENFLDDHYNANDGHFYLEGISPSNRFIRWGMNGIMSGINDLLKQYPGKRAALIWNEISKLSAKTEKGGGPVDAAVHEIEKECFHVIPTEVEILKPDILVFLTGPGNNRYYGYIKENFDVGEAIQLSGLPISDVAKLAVKGVKLAYKTYHPNAHGTNEAFHWQHYQAILDDIKANIGVLINRKQ